MNFTEIAYMKIIGENKTKTITQKQWKVHAKSVKGSTCAFVFRFKNPKTL